MKMVDGSWNGTGSAVVICCGFVPDFVYARSLDDAGACIIWDRLAMDDAGDAAGGLTFTQGAATQAETDEKAGIRLYQGGDTLTATMAGTTTYGEGEYLKKDVYDDYRWGTNLGPGNRSGDAVSQTIDTWTLDNATNYTGHWNEDITGTFIKIGSFVTIDGITYRIVALTGGQGESANEVGLDYPAPSGRVDRISGCHTYKPMIAGEITPAGFTMLDTGDLVNTDDEYCYFKAGQYDN